MTSPGASTPRSSWLTLSAVCLVSVLMSLNMNTLNIALPILTRHFDASPTAASWLLLSYMVTNCALLVPFGRLADSLGQRRVYLWGLGTFIIAGFLCGLAPDIETLIALRALQAVGSAALLANGATLIHDAFPASRLSNAMGFYTASFSVAALIGPTLGGFIAELGGWQWVFWFSLPLAVPAFLWGVRQIAGRPPAQTRASLDGAGNGVLMTILILATFGISRASDLGWTHPLIIWTLAVSVALVPALVAIERRATNPILNAEVLRSNGVASIYTAGFLNGAARFPIVIVMGLYFQAVQGHSAAVAGLYLLPVPAGMISTAMLLGRFAKRYDPRLLATVGSLIGMVGLGIVLASSLLQHDALLLGGLTLTGAGTGVFMGSNTTALLTALPEQAIGVGNAVRLMLQNVGNLLSVAVSLALIAGVLPREKRSVVMQADADGVAGVTPAELAPGFHAALVFLLALSLFGVLSCARGQRLATRAARCATPATSAT
ncbi:MFS transporter [Cumulibacter manganitolerans]|uniref:MFS transporter n=1 Tax=Cumulibacter manganitolerans TaxID=1884992 RepID=UPI001297442B|nr:MFS transporter [Cumulibacter manganitolerans]